jgi:hypothetical protein
VKPPRRNNRRDRRARPHARACGVGLTLALAALAAPAQAETSGLPMVPKEDVQLTGTIEPQHGPRIGLRVERLALTYEKGLTIRIRCLHCLRGSKAARGVRGSRALHGVLLPNHAVLLISITHAGEIGRLLTYINAGSRQSQRRLRGSCLPPHSKPVSCRSLGAGTLAAGPLAAAPPAGVGGAHGIPVTGPPAEAVNRTAVTSVDDTLGDLAPYSGPFEIAFQPFVASSQRITYVGVTLANPQLPPGAAPGENALLRVCADPACSGTVLASTIAAVVNYGLTTAAIEADVTPGASYYLVWTPPADVHGAPWITFWHGGGQTITASEQMEALVRGYDPAGSLGPREILSYAGEHAPPYPYSGPFLYAYQDFHAASDTITRLGVVVGNPALPRGAEGPETVLVKLCQTPECGEGGLASSRAPIVNYGVSEADIGDVPVTPGGTYYVYWQTPRAVSGQPWVTFWLGHSPRPEEAQAMQAFAKGYDHGPAIVPTYYSEQAGSFGAPTFADPYNAAEEGPRIAAMGHVEVLCRVFAPQIESTEPDGYWYRLASEPFDGRFYAAANVFWNGQSPGVGETINTDLAVPICPPAS